MGYIVITLPGIDTMEDLRAEAVRIDGESQGGFHFMISLDEPHNYTADSEGVWCDGCNGHAGPPGVRWPTEANGDSSRHWVERCDMCGVYETDAEAAQAVIAQYEGSNAKIEHGMAEPWGVDYACPYVEVS
jgi:hypothetical protein